MEKMGLGIIVGPERWGVAARLYAEKLIDRIRVLPEGFSTSPPTLDTVLYDPPEYKVILSAELIVPSFGFELMYSYDQEYAAHREQLDLIEQRFSFWSVWFRDVGEFAAKDPPEFAANRANPA